MKLKSHRSSALWAFLVGCSLAITANAILVQPYNYMLDDSALISQHDSSGSLSPFYNDQSGSTELAADKDIISIIGDRLARLKYARMLQHQHQDEHGFSQEMAELMSQQSGVESQKDGQPEASLSSSVASMLMNVAQAAAQAAAPERDEPSGSHQASEGASKSSAESPMSMSSRGSIMELDTSSGSAASGNSAPSKADLKSAQWFNPKETIPVLKISSMATPSKYKKVYFRSEKKLVDGAFHSIPSSEQDDKKRKSSLMKPFNSGVQRRSSRGTSSSVAPPSVLQDGVIDFLKKFRDVYIQTRPAAAAASPASGMASFASNLFSASASSPLASFIAPPSSSSSGSRPNFASSALQAASSMVNSAAMVAQAASSAPASGSSGAGSGASAVANAAAAATGGSSNGIRAPLTAQSYVSFWSKTFPTWVRKMLKQLRRRSLYNSSKRHQSHHQHSSSLGQAAQAAASNAVASVVDQATSGSSSSSSSSSGSSSH